MSVRIPGHAVDGLPAGAVGDLTDVDTTTTPPTEGDVLTWDGTAWVPVTVVDGGTL